MPRKDSNADRQNPSMYLGTTSPLDYCILIWFLFGLCRVELCSLSVVQIIEPLAFFLGKMYKYLPRYFGRYISNYVKGIRSLGIEYQIAEIRGDLVECVLWWRYIVPQQHHDS